MRSSLQPHPVSSDRPAAKDDQATQKPEQQVDRVARVVLGVDGVHSLHGGAKGEVGTYLPGRRVSGIRLKGQACEVHVALEWESDIYATAQSVRDALRPEFSGAVDVVVEDVLSPEQA